MLASSARKLVWLGLTAFVRAERIETYRTEFLRSSDPQGLEDEPLS